MEAKDMIPVGTKVSPEARERMRAICQKKGVSEYDMLQMFYDVAIRMMDDRHNLSYDMERMIQLFDGMQDWRTSIRLTDCMDKMQVQEAFYVLTEQKRTGTRMVNITGEQNTFFRTENYNVQEIVERFVCLAMPRLYKRLRLLGTDMGTGSVYETLTRIVDEYVTNPDAEELRLMFADNDWERGHKTGDQQRTKQTRIHNPKMFE